MSLGFAQSVHATDIMYSVRITWMPEYAGPSLIFTTPQGQCCCRNLGYRGPPHLFFCNSITDYVQLTSWTISNTGVGRMTALTKASISRGVWVGNRARRRASSLRPSHSGRRFQRTYESTSFSALIFCAILLSPPSERSEWRRYCFLSMYVTVCVRVCVCLCVCPLLCACVCVCLSAADRSIPATSAPFSQREQHQSSRPKSQLPTS